METPGSQISEKDIQKIIDDYLHNVPALFKKFVSGPKSSQENYRFNRFGQQPYLIIAKCDLARLPIRILRRLPVHLIKQFVVQVELDSLWYWALTRDIVESRAGDSILNQWPLRPVFTTLLAAHFAKLGSAPVNWAIHRLNRIIYDVVSESIKDLVGNRDIVQMYLCYPVLEGLVKFAMLPIVDLDGTVKATLSDGKKSYNPGHQISSLASLLRLLEINAPTFLSRPDLAIDLKDFRLQTELVVPPTQIVPPHIRAADGWDSVYYLRNPALHGAKEAQLRSGLITNLICLIIWHLLDDQGISEELQRIAKRPKHFGFPSRYYPPES